MCLRKRIKLLTTLEYLTPQLCAVSAFTPTSPTASAGHIWHGGTDNISKQTLAVIPLM